MDTSDFEKMEVERRAESDRLIFHHSVPELVKLTCFRLTLDLWSCSLQDPSDDLKTTFKNRIGDLIKELGTNVSDLTKNTITWYSERILKLSSMWVTYHKERVFKDWDIELIGGMCFPELIWRPDGSIDGFKSAEALIKSANLGDELEYKLVCLYCVENRIVDMWSRLADDECVVLDVFFDEEISLLSYWNSQMAGYFSKSGMKSVENRLLANETIDNLSAAVYFFDRFTTEERVEKGCQLIPCVKLDDRAQYVKTMLSKFDEKELHRAFQLHCSDIMYPLIMNRVHAKCAFEVWDRVKNILTIQSFLSIMTRITATLRIALKNRNRRFVGELDNYVHFKRHVFAVIGDLWRITPSTLKKHNLTSSWRGVIYYLVENFVCMRIKEDPEARFLFNVMSDANDKLYRRLLSKFASLLVWMFGFRVFSELVDARHSLNWIFPRLIIYDYGSLVSMFRAKKFAQVNEYFETCVSRRLSFYRNPKKCWMFEKLYSIEPVNIFHPFELTDEEVDQLRKFISDVGEEAEDFLYFSGIFNRKLYSYYPRLWPEPMEICDNNNEEFQCYAGLERS